MKRQINCDQVFEILTRGPFPSGDPHDAAVEMHLLACHECRELAEALRPAVDLFHESIPASDQEDLPGYNGVLCRLEQELSQERGDTLVVKPQVRLRQILQQAVSKDPVVNTFMGAMLVASVLFAFAWFGPIGKTGNRSTNASPGNPITGLRPSGERLLASLDLPAACRRANTMTDAATESDTAVTQNGIQCCTQCHSVSQRIPHAPNALSKIIDSCIACHTVDASH